MVKKDRFMMRNQQTGFGSSRIHFEISDGQLHELKTDEFLISINR